MTAVQCELCGMRFSAEEKVTEHLLDVHVDQTAVEKKPTPAKEEVGPPTLNKVYACKECPYAAKKNGNLMTHHRAVHLGIK